MFGALGYGAIDGVNAGKDADLRRYARWEYGRADAGWILIGARRTGRLRVVRAGNGGRFPRLRYWLNSFRGFGAFDVRGADGRA